MGASTHPVPQKGPLLPYVPGLNFGASQRACVLRPSVLGEPFIDRLARTAPGKIVVHVEQTAGLQAWPKQLELSGRALVPVGVEAQHADFLGQACCAQRVLHFAFDVAHALVVPIAKYASHVALHVAERAKVPLSGGCIDEVDSKARRNVPSVVRRIPLLFGAIAVPVVSVEGAVDDPAAGIIILAR